MAYYKLEAKNAIIVFIISAPPPTSSGLVSNLYHHLSAKLVRAETLAELSCYDRQDIKLNGGDNTFRNKNVSEPEKLVQITEKSL